MARARELQAGDKRRVVGEAQLAPRVLVAALLGAQSGDEQVIKAVAAAPARPAPADLAPLVAVQGAKGVAKAERPQAADEQQFGSVPALSALGAQAAVAVARERPHAAVGVLAARCVEVSAQDARVTRPP